LQPFPLSHTSPFPRERRLVVFSQPPVRVWNTSKCEFKTSVFFSFPCLLTHFFISQLHHPPSVPFPSPPVGFTPPFFFVHPSPNRLPFPPSLPRFFCIVWSPISACTRPPPTPLMLCVVCSPPFFYSSLYFSAPSLCFRSRFSSPSHQHILCPLFKRPPFPFYPVPSHPGPKAHMVKQFHSPTDPHLTSFFIRVQSEFSAAVPLAHQSGSVCSSPLPFKKPPASVVMSFFW